MKKLLVILSRSWGIQVIHPLMKEILRIDPNFEIYGLVHRKKTNDFLKNQQDVSYQKLWLLDELWDKALDFKYNSQISINEIEYELGIDSIWELISTVRSLVYDMRSNPIFKYKKTVDDDFMLRLVKVFFLHIKKVWATSKPDIIVTHGFITMYHIMLYLYAKKRNIYMFCIGDTKVSEYYIEQNTPKIMMPKRINNIYNKNLINFKNSPNYNVALEFIKENRNKIKDPGYATFNKISLNRLNKQAIRKILFLPYHIAIWIKNFLLVTNQTRIRFKYLDNLTPIDLIKNAFREYFCLKYFNRIKFYKPREKEKFVYFPLQYEPEAHTMVQALYFTNQLESIRLTAMALPGEYTLYVKEHPHMYGKRKPGYYKKILGMPNVKFISYRHPSDEIIKKCSAVVTATGTSSFEAALLQKPSIMFGEDLTLVLPQIKHVTDFTKLSEVFQEILNEDFSKNKYEEALIAYIVSIMDAGFKAIYSKLTSKDNYKEIKKWADFMYSTIQSKIKR